MIYRSLGIAASSLFAQQRSMDVIAQNIANANTPGYSRQTPELASAEPERLNGRDFGRGVVVSDIRRLVDPILQRAQVQSDSLTNYWQTLQQGLSGVESTFGNLDSPGLTSSLDDFFNATQDLANRPDDAIVRLNVQARGQNLAAHIGGMRQQLVDAQTAEDAQIEPILADVNRLLDNIADLSRRIRITEGTAAGPGSANDLRDQRDQAVRQLAQLIPLQQVDTKDGHFLLQTPAGDLLTQGSLVRHLKIGSGGSGFANVVFTDTNLTAQGLTGGGKLGALLSLRDTKLAGYIQQLDSLAANLTFAVNRVHASGTGTSAVTKYTAGQTASNPAGAVDADTGVPFAAQIVSGSFKVHLYDATGTPLTPGGTTITVTAGTTTLNQIVTDISAIAGVSASIDATGHLVVDGGANRVVFSDDTSDFLAAYEVNAFFHGASAANFSLAAGVAADAGSISTGAADPATSQLATADSSVALGLLALRDTAVSFDGSTSASAVARAANLASSFGLDVAAASQQRSFREAEASSLAQQRESISGVNVDEELIKMMEFQRAYEAAAKVIQSSNQMMDALMGLIR